MQVPVDKYLEHALNFTEQEYAIRDAVLEQLPDVIIDAHVHTHESKYTGTISPFTLAHMMSTFPHFSLEMSLRIRDIFFHGKEVRSLRFPHVMKGMDHRGANEHLLNNAPGHDRVSLYGIPDDIEYTTRKLADPRIYGLKMYPRYFEPPVQTIYEYFPPEVLEAAQAQDVPITLHLPKMITACVDDLKLCVDDFPRLKIVLAHLGLPHLPIPGLREAYNAIAKHKYVFMDTAMIPSVEVVFIALQAFGSSRILYGSDEPVNLLRNTVFMHPTKGERITTTYPYHWVDPEEHAEYCHLAETAVHAHWQCIQAILSATSRFAPNNITETKQRVFHDNAEAVFGF